MNNPFDYTPDAACDAAFRELLARMDALKESRRPEDVNFCRELEAGKMLGVLVAEDENGGRHVLYAFSGQLGNAGFRFPGFVEPVFDYLRPDGYFKIKEREISCRNSEIDEYERGPLARIRGEYESARIRLDAEVAEYKEFCRQSKLKREAERGAGLADENRLKALTRQSQHEKAELRRLRKSVAARLAPLEAELRQGESRLAAMKSHRRDESDALQQWLFSNFRVLNALGEERSLNEIFAETSMRVAPSGAGECCAPKLLQAAYVRGLRPLSIAEYWYGRPKGGEVRVHGSWYPACRGKCLPVLGWMLRGLPVEPPLEQEILKELPQEPDIVFANDRFCVVDKPSGMLSVPGKGRATSVQQWLSETFTDRGFVRMVHRLDRDTSGLIVAAFDPDAYRLLQSLFATRRVDKTYIALLEGDREVRGLPRCGRVSLPLMPDWLDRPRQRVDKAQGKEAVTEYEFTGVSGGRSRVRFHPLTGRTHQLRVHAASADGLGMPIAGDPLYGRDGGAGCGRLLLHACRIEFVFPPDGRVYSFESQPPF